MTHSPKQLAFLVGIGADTFSVTPSFLPQVQRTLAALSIQEAQEFAGKLLQAGSLAEIEQLTAAFAVDAPV